MKPKPIVYIVALLFLSSCSRSIYYAFEEEGTYCTLEEKKNGTVIYRAISKEHYTESSTMKEYIHIESYNSSHEDYTGIGMSFILRYINHVDSHNIGICTTTDNYSLTDNYIHYSKSEHTDSIPFLKGKYLEEIEKEPCFTEHKITWFPPYLKKVKKIDYKKFNLPLKEKYLKTMADKDK